MILLDVFSLGKRPIFRALTVSVSGAVQCEVVSSIVVRFSPTARDIVGIRRDR